MKIGISTACLYPMLTEKSLEEVGKSGIKDAEIFFNSMGELEKDFVYVSGQNLKIIKLTPEEKYLSLSGQIKSINYSSTMSKKSFFGKVFK